MRWRAGARSRMNFAITLPGMTTVLNKCISADSHVTEPPGTYIDRIDPKFRDRAPRLHHDDELGDVMLIDNGKSLVPFWLVAAAGRPTEEIRLDTGKRFEDLWRGGWDPVARLADQDTDGVVRRGHLPVGRHAALQPPRRRLPARVLRRVQPVDRRVLRDRARPAHRDGPDRAASRPRTASRDLEAIKALGLRA